MVNSMRIQQGKGRTPAHSLSVTEEEMVNEGEYDDVWPARSPSSSRRYQGLADVRTETGRTANVQDQAGRRGYRNLAGERHTIPPRRTTLQAKPSSRGNSGEENIQGTVSERLHRGGLSHQRNQKRLHWLFFVGLAMLIMIFGWIALSALGTWWQTTQDDWHYGRPRTFQTDQVVGHHDSSQNPSHFIAMNLNHHVVIIEIPGGDVSKSIVFSGPTLLGPGQDLTPVTLTFQDVNHDGKLDMIVNIQGNELVFLNANGTFVTPGQNQNPGG